MCSRVPGGGVPDVGREYSYVRTVMMFLFFSFCPLLLLIWFDLICFVAFCSFRMIRLQLHKDQLLRAPSVGKHNWIRRESTREERTEIKMQGTNRSGEGGRRACYVTPDLSYD